MWVTDLKLSKGEINHVDKIIGVSVAASFSFSQLSFVIDIPQNTIINFSFKEINNAPIVRSPRECRVG